MNLYALYALTPYGRDLREHPRSYGVRVRPYAITDRPSVQVSGVKALRRIGRTHPRPEGVA